MNKNQLEFLVGRFGWKLVPAIYLPTAAAGLDIMDFDKPLHFNIAIGGIAAGLCVTSGYLLGSFLRDYKKVKKIKSNKDNPSSQVNTVFIEDNKGLEHLLERTRFSEKLEWGTIFKLVTSNNQASIYEIMNSYEAEKKEIITNQKSSTLDIKFGVPGYSGCHHYHPCKNNAMSFTINSTDRFLSTDLNLLTFNMQYGPELIAFTWKNVYIPEDKKTPKNRLHKADWKQIYKYLR